MKRIVLLISLCIGGCVERGAITSAPNMPTDMNTHEIVSHRDTSVADLATERRELCSELIAKEKRAVHTDQLCHQRREELKQWDKDHCYMVDGLQSHIATLQDSHGEFHTREYISHATYECDGTTPPSDYKLSCRDHLSDSRLTECKRFKPNQ